MPFIPQYNGGLLGQAGTILNSGIQGGLLAYDQYKQRQQQNDQFKSTQELQKQKQAADLVEKNLEVDPATNQVRKNFLGQEQDRIAKAENLAASPESEQQRAMVSAALKGAGRDDIANAITDQTTGAQARAIHDQYKKDIEEGYGLKKARIMGDTRINLKEMITPQAQDRIQNAANAKYDSKMAPFENTVQSANRADEIINRIKNGELKSTPTLATDLAASMGSMFNNGKAATVYGMSHSNIDSLEGRFHKLEGYLTGNAVDTLPQGQLEQLQKDIQSLRGSYLKGHETAYKSWIKGMSESVKPKLDERFNEFRQLSNPGQEQQGPQGLVPQGMVPRGMLSAPAPQPSGASVGPHGPSVTQGGHTFVWNPQSQKYE